MQDTGDTALASGLSLLERLVAAEAEYRNLDKAVLDWLSLGRWIQQGQNLLITGPTGAGKSYLASALGRRACQLGMSTLYFNCTKFWPQLRQSRGRDRNKKEVRAIAKTELIILDDRSISTSAGNMA